MRTHTQHFSAEHIGTTVRCFFGAWLAVVLVSFAAADCQAGMMMLQGTTEGTSFARCLNVPSDTELLNDEPTLLEVAVESTGMDSSHRGTPEWPISADQLRDSLVAGGDLGGGLSGSNFQLSSSSFSCGAILNTPIESAPCAVYLHWRAQSLDLPAAPVFEILDPPKTHA